MKTVFMCNECGYESNKWLGKCPGCGEWNTFVEEIIEKKTKNKKKKKSKVGKPKLLKDIKISDKDRMKTKISELDRVLGGGIVKGSLTLFGGDPGIGKSTLLLQVADKLESKILYVSGEESEMQIKLRAERLLVTNKKLNILAETNLNLIEKIIEKDNPDMVIIDSIQTIYSDDLKSSPGSVSQVRAVTGELLRIAKQNGTTIMIVGHVTKKGSIAGPRVLEHMVDVVLYFEGERHESYRILRAVKNRFGSTNEIGVFEMKTKGLMELKNPSKIMISERDDEVSGSIITCSMEGTRPILLEIQALVSDTSFGMPRRTSTGIDNNRVNLLMAVLEKKLGMQLGNQDSYVNLTGGIKVKEPALDLAIIGAIASSFMEKEVKKNVIVFGEVGLTGEVRAVNMIEKRIKEAEKMGFEYCIVPKSNLKNFKENKFDIKVIGVKNVNEALKRLL